MDYSNRTSDPAIAFTILAGGYVTLRNVSFWSSLYLILLPSQESRGRRLFKPQQGDSKEGVGRYF
jgi:hypothetical protein